MKRALAMLLAATSTVYAGGTQRPNGISARGVGMGGAWAAWVDDATAIWFNPGALDAIVPHVLLGIEYVLAPREFTPIAADGTRGEPQSTTVSSPVPVLGIAGRFNTDGAPSRVTLGLGVWNTFGGRVSYPRTGLPALDVTQDLCIEVNGAASFHVSDRFSVGGAFRLGIGFFHVESTMNPFDANLSASGVGVGMTWGALFRPSDDVRVALNWRSPLRITTKGSGTVMQGGATDRPDVVHEQSWPQQVQLGVGVRVSPVLKVAGQVDWTQWSQLDTIVVEFPDGGLPTQVYPAYWSDNWSFRVGGEYAVSSTIAVRSGVYYDTPAVPDRTIERQYSDSHKLGVSLGGSLRAAGWRFDMGVDGIIPRTRTVPNNANEVMGFTVLQNKAPGEYTGTLLTFELAAAREF